MTQFKVHNPLYFKIIVSSFLILPVVFVISEDFKLSTIVVTSVISIYIILRTLLPKVIVNGDKLRYQTHLLLYKTIKLSDINKIESITKETHITGSVTLSGTAFIMKISGKKNNKTFKFNINYNCKNSDKLLKLVRSQYGVKLVVKEKNNEYI